MIPKEWFHLVKGELESAGFECKPSRCFVIVKFPSSDSEYVRLLRFEPSVPCWKVASSRGVLFTPIGKQ